MESLGLSSFGRYEKKGIICKFLKINDICYSILIIQYELYHYLIVVNGIFKVMYLSNKIMVVT